MEILVICDRYPFPLDNGQNLRVFNYIYHLNKYHVFDLICYGDVPPPPEIVSLFRHIKAFSKPADNLSKRGLSKWAEAFDVEKMIVQSKEVKEYIESILPQRSYDLVWMSGWDMVTNLPQKRAFPFLADIVDDGVLEYSRELRRSRTPRRFVTVLKRLFMNYLFEKRYFCSADQCLLVSEVDAASLKRVCPDTAIAVLHNGVDVEYFKPLGGEQHPLNIVFEGRMDFGPNTDGILYFHKMILPFLQKQFPELKLTIVGKSPPSEVLALASDNVEVTGYVDDVRPYLDHAAVFVCPLRKGAGIKNKILQAWAMGKAVVATPASTGGLLVKDGENIYVRDDPEQFAMAVLELLQNPSKRQNMGLQARQTILDHYTWQSKALALEVIMQQTVTRYRKNGAIQCAIT